MLFTQFTIEPDSEVDLYSFHLSRLLVKIKDEHKSLLSIADSEDIHLLVYKICT